jgi:hypothetical protein
MPPPSSRFVDIPRARPRITRTGRRIEFRPILSMNPVNAELLLPLLSKRFYLEEGEGLSIVPFCSSEDIEPDVDDEELDEEDELDEDFDTDE